MAAGIEVFDENGSLLFTTEERITRLMSSFDVDNSGELSAIDLSGAVLWAVFVPRQLTTWSSHRNTYPAVSVSGNRISWAYPDPVYRVPGSIIYGVY